MKFKYILFVSLLFIGILGKIHGKIKVCTTTSLIANMAEQIGGENIDLVSLMGPGVDPHLYKAANSDLKKINNADIIFYNGLHLEGRMIDIFESLTKQGKTVFAISEGIEKNALITIKGGNGYDPHIWFDPRLWSQCVDTMINALSKKDPENSQNYKERGNVFKKKLQELYKWGTIQSESLSKNERILITSHDAYNYFGRAFNFQVIGVQGVSTASEAGLADIVSTVDFIKKHKIKSIFVESSVSPAAIERISEDSKVKIGGELFSDSLGAKGEILCNYDVGNYIGMFQYNMETIIKGLKWK